jgi:hypothetical protein
LGNADEIFDEGGALKSERTRKFLTNFIDAYAHWVTACLGHAAPTPKHENPLADRTLVASL